jgi:hypothetical protein
MDVACKVQKRFSHANVPEFGATVRNISKECADSYNILPANYK